MWDPTCLASPACEETRSIYRLSTPPTPVVDEPMPSPQKPSPAKEWLQTVTEEEVEIVGEVIVNKHTLKPPSRSDIIARAMRQSKSSPVTITLNSSESSPAKSPPAPATSKTPKKKASSPPKVPIAPLALQPGDGRPGQYTVHLVNAADSRAHFRGQAD